MAATSLIENCGEHVSRLKRQKLERRLELTFTEIMANFKLNIFSPINNRNYD